MTRLKLCVLLGIAATGLWAAQASAFWSMGTSCQRVAAGSNFNGCVATATASWDYDSGDTPPYQNAYCTLNGVKIYDARNDKSNPEYASFISTGAPAPCGKQSQFRCYIVNNGKTTQLGNPPITLCPPM